MEVLCKRHNGLWRATLTPWRHRSLFYRDPALSGSDRPERLTDEVLAWLRDHGHTDVESVWYGFDGRVGIEFRDEPTAIAFKLRWL